MFDVLSQLLKMFGILLLWYFIIYEVPKQEKEGMFHALFDLIKEVPNQTERGSNTKRNRTTLSKIWVFIDKVLITVPGNVCVILQSSKWFVQAVNDLMIALQNLVN
jgi:hypothetical protein